MNSLNKIFNVLLIVVFSFCFGYAESGNQSPSFDLSGPADLNTSLHVTSEGMRTWFTNADGFGPLTGIDYETLSCKNCHVEPNDCAVCHGNFTQQMEKDPATCYPCHGRQNKEKALGITDLHMEEYGMNCASCHSSDEVHGDGTVYTTMLEPGVFDTKCTKCHNNISSSFSHETHTETLECQACHVKTVITCYNCHFESQVIEDVKRPFGAISNFVILLNDERTNKVNVGTYQSLTYQGKSFVVFAPFMGHSITREARQCQDCHNSENMQQLEAEGVVQLTKWENDTIQHMTGAIPLVDGNMVLQYVDYDAQSTTWSPTKTETDQVQYAATTPLTDDQLAKLKQAYGTEVKDWQLMK